jgi:hypothetical protein
MSCKPCSLIDNRPARLENRLFQLSTIAVPHYQYTVVFPEIRADTIYRPHWGKRQVPGIKGLMLFPEPIRALRKQTYNFSET